MQPDNDKTQRPLRSSVRLVTPAAVAREKGVSDGHARNLISEMAKRGELRRIAKGTYVPGEGRSRRLQPTNAVRRVARVLTQTLPGLRPVVFSTGQIAPFMHNIPARELVLVATATPHSRTIARALAAGGITAQPVRRRSDMERLLELPGDPLVAIIPVGDTRATEPFFGVHLATPERVLVDVVIGIDRIGLPIYPEDVQEVGRALLTDFGFSISRALDYARRRGAYPKVERFLRDLISEDKNLRVYRTTIRD